MALLSYTKSYFAASLLSTDLISVSVAGLILGRSYSACGHRQKWERKRCCFF